MVRERILQCAARLAWAAVIIATLAACSATSPSSTAALGAPSQSATAAASQASTTACSTQGGGGDNIPVPCAPTTSPSGHGLTPPATFPGETPPSACSDPMVISVSPGTGSKAGGDFVTITGTGFGLGLEVFFGGSPSLYALRSATVVVATSPPGTPGPAVVTVSCAGVVSRSSPAVEFTYQAVAGSPADGSPDAMPPSSPTPVAPSPSA